MLAGIRGGKGMRRVLHLTPAQRWEVCLATARAEMEREEAKEVVEVAKQAA